MEGREDFCSVVLAVHQHLLWLSRVVAGHLPASRRTAFPGPSCCYEYMGPNDESHQELEAEGCASSGSPALRFPPAGTWRCTFALARQVNAQGSLDGRAWGGEETQVSECLWEAELPVNLDQSAQTAHALGSKPLNQEGLRCSPLCCVKSHQSCPTLCDPMDCSPPGSAVGCHALLQGICPTQGSNLPLLSPAWAAGSWPLASPGKPIGTHIHMEIWKGLLIEILTSQTRASENTLGICYWLSGKGKR